MPRQSSPYETILAFCVLLLLCYLLVDLSWAAPASLTLGLLGLLSERFAQAVHQGWMFLSTRLNAFITPILLAMVFFIVLCPLAFFYRLAGKAQMRQPQEANSNFVERNHDYNAEDLEKPW